MSFHASFEGAHCEYECLYWGCNRSQTNQILSQKSNKIIFQFHLIQRQYPRPYSYLTVSLQLHILILWAWGCWTGANSNSVTEDFRDSALICLGREFTGETKLWNILNFYLLLLNPIKVTFFSFKCWIFTWASLDITYKKPPWQSHVVAVK